MKNITDLLCSAIGIVTKYGQIQIRGRTCKEAEKASRKDCIHSGVYGCTGAANRRASPESIKPALCKGCHSTLGAENFANTHTQSTEA